jgi:hypothetical protein
VSGHWSDPGPAPLAAAKAARGRECRSCGIVVPDAAWAAVCDLNGIEFKRDAGMRTCPRCIRDQRNTGREEGKRSRSSTPSRPPLGLRITRGGDRAA